jgi:hypothetical protein
MLTGGRLRGAGAVPVFDGVVEVGPEGAFAGEALMAEVWWKNSAGWKDESGSLKRDDELFAQVTGRWRMASGDVAEWYGGL